MNQIQQEKLKLNKELLDLSVKTADTSVFHARMPKQYGVQDTASEFAVVTGDPATIDDEHVSVHVTVFRIGEKQCGDCDFVC